MTQELIAHIFSLAKEYSRLCGDIAKQVPFEDYNHIREYEVKLNAFGNLLSVSDTTKFLQAEIEEAKSYLADFRLRLGVPLLRSGGDQMSIPRHLRKLDAGFPRVVSLKIGAPTMSIHVEIPEPLAGQVAQAAKTQGKTPEDVVLETIQTRFNAFARLDELMAPVRQRIAELGETEEDVVEFFEKVKHEMRQERRMAGK